MARAVEDHHSTCGSYILSVSTNAEEYSSRGNNWVAVSKVQTTSKCNILVKNVVYCDVTPCGSCKNRYFGGTYLRLNQNGKNQRARKIVSNR
jgi:hypothetical protein